jgi:hypothetical protein
MAWLIAWPLTQLGLLAQPGLAHFGGLSGVLHAGVAVVAALLIIEGPRRRRWLGVALLAGLAIKLLSETPWGAPVQQRDGLDVGVAPLSHVTGVLSGLVACTLLLGMQRLHPEAAAHE